MNRRKETDEHPFHVLLGTEFWNRCRIVFGLLGGELEVPPSPWVYRTATVCAHFLLKTVPELRNGVALESAPFTSMKELPSLVVAVSHGNLSIVCVCCGFLFV